MSAQNLTVYLYVKKLTLIYINPFSGDVSILHNSFFFFNENKCKVNLWSVSTKQSVVLDK